MPTIIISGQPGAGNSTTAKMLAKSLKLKHWSAGDYVKQFGRSSAETQRAVEAWRGAASKKEFHVELDKKTVEVVKQGNVVIDGKLAIHFAGKFADLRVWLKCPVAVRAKRLTNRDKISLSEAKKVLAEKESLERTRFLEMYNFDPAKQEAEADLVLDSGALTPKQIVEKIRTELEK